MCCKVIKSLYLTHFNLQSLQFSSFCYVLLSNNSIEIQIRNLFPMNMTKTSHSILSVLETTFQCEL